MGLVGYVDTVFGLYQFLDHFGKREISISSDEAVCDSASTIYGPL
jgi:hypothetical protein